MKQEQALSDVVMDTSPLLGLWVCNGLGINPNDMAFLLTLGFLWRGKLVGGLLFSDYHLGHDVSFSIYTTDKRWCQLRVLRKIFAVAFEDLHCQRISVLVAADNQASLKLVKKLGFQQEGLLRRFRPEDDKDCYIFSLLKDECRFLDCAKKSSESRS